MMDSRRSTKTRSYVDPSNASPASHVSRSSASLISSHRPSIGDRTHSAPSVAASRERQERRQTRTSSLAQQGSRSRDGSRAENEAWFSPGPTDEEETVHASNGFCLVSFPVFDAPHRSAPVTVLQNRAIARTSANCMTTTIID